MKKSHLSHDSNFYIFCSYHFLYLYYFSYFFHSSKIKKGHQRLFVDILRFDFLRNFYFI